MSSRQRAARVQDAHAYLLHATPWRETSSLIRVFSRDHGNLALVAKGAKRPYSQLRAVLSVFQPLSLSWSGAGEVKTLTHAETQGTLFLTGGAFMSAWYMNELLLRLLPREDPHPVVFDAYDDALRRLASGARAAGALRRFEWVLLREAGYGLDEAEPNFDDLAQEPALRKRLREQLEAQLVGRPLTTRKVLQDLQQI